jgi:hypothetical protein
MIDDIMLQLMLQLMATTNHEENLTVQMIFLVASSFATKIFQLQSN